MSGFKCLKRNDNLLHFFLLQPQMWHDDKGNARPPSGFLRHPAESWTFPGKIACNGTTQQQRADWNSTWRLRERKGEREYISTVQCLLSSNKHALSRPHCVRSPCSPLCKHPLCTPPRLYSEPEQEVISYPTSASVFLSQVVNVPGSRPPRPRKGVMRSGQGTVQREG